MCRYLRATASILWRTRNWRPMRARGGEGAAQSGKRRFWALKAWWKGVHSHYSRCQGGDVAANYLGTGAVRQHCLHHAFRTYGVLDFSGFHHRRTNHFLRFARHRSHINGINRELFCWLIKECEWRFNGGNCLVLKSYFTGSKYAKTLVSGRHNLNDHRDTERAEGKSEN